MSDWEDRRFNLEYDSAISLRYHGRRRTFLDVMARLDPCLSIILGGAAFASVMADHKTIAALASLATAGTSAIALAFNLSDRARLHSEIYKRWAELRAKLAVLETDNDIGLCKIEVERELIEADSPSTLTALSALCENEEKRVRRSGDLYELGWLQLLLVNVITMPWFKLRVQEPAT